MGSFGQTGDPKSPKFHLHLSLQIPPPPPPQVYASGKDVVILDGKLKHIQTVLGSDCGYGDTRISCVHCAELVGKIAVAWGSDVVIFEPEPLEETSGATEVCLLPPLILPQCETFPPVAT